MNEIFIFISAKLLEPIYFSLFLIIGKDLKKKRLLFTLIMILEYILLTSLIKFNMWFQFIYTFLSFINLKVLYKEKSQITDIFLFTVASIFLIIISALAYASHIFIYNNYDLARIINRILLFSFLYLSKNKIKKWYKEFYSLWNRHHNPNKIKSLTVRNISVISFNTMFWLINLGMLYANLIE